MINIHVDMTRRLLFAISIIRTHLAKRAGALALSLGETDVRSAREFFDTVGDNRS
jgi:hypothetical protein